MLLENFDDGCEGNTNTACQSAQFTPVDPSILENMTCSESEEFFWVAFLAVPLGMLMLESGGENALVQPVVTKGASIDSSTKSLSVMELRGNGMRGDGSGSSGVHYFGMCLCTRTPNPQYELFHPIWHVLGLFGPLFACVYFLTQCEPSVLGSIKTVHVPALPFIDLLELPLVPTCLLLISVMNSIQLNVTGIKPPRIECQADQCS